MLKINNTTINTCSLNGNMVRSIVKDGICIYRAQRNITICFTNTELYKEYRQYFDVQVIRTASKELTASLGLLSPEISADYLFYSVFDGDEIEIIVKNTFISTAAKTLTVNFPATWQNGMWQGIVGSSNILFDIEILLDALDFLPLEISTEAQSENSYYINVYLYNPNPFPVEVSFDDYGLTDDGRLYDGRAWAHSGYILDAYADSGEQFCDDEFLSWGYLEVQATAVDYPELGTVTTYDYPLSWTYNTNYGDIREWQFYLLSVSGKYSYADDGNDMLDVVVEFHNGNEFDVECHIETPLGEQDIYIAAGQSYYYSEDCYENEDGEWIIWTCQPAGFSHLQGDSGMWLYIDDMSSSCEDV